MDEKTILQHSKDLTLNYLKKINAEVSEQDDIYYITLPQEVEKIFGGSSKKITFNPDVAATHSYELVVPGSNFLSIVLRETQKHASVITGIIPKNEQNISEALKKIDSNDCKISLGEQIQSEKLGIRFYFHENLKSVKNSSSIRWIDLELDTLKYIQLPFELNFNEHSLSLEQNDVRFDNAYSKAIELLENDIRPRIEKYVSLTKQDKEEEEILVDAHEKKSLEEIKHDLDNERYKLREYDRKIERARNTQTMTKHANEKAKFEKKLTKITQESTKRINKITNDKQTTLRQIERRYKPSLEFALLAAQVYSYSIVDCFLTVQKEEKRKQIKGQYVDITSSFITNCEVCQNDNEVIHLCENSHVSCDQCTKNCLNCKKNFCLNCKTQLNPCYICKDGLCENCSKKCEFCSDVTCFSHSLTCEHCSKFLCYFCSEHCAFCSKGFCDKAVYSCKKCNQLACQNDSETCGVCSEVFCVEHQNSCSICLKPHCSQDTKTCKNCKCEYGSTCVKKEKCDTCQNLKTTNKEHPQVKLLIEKYPQYQKHKKWEYAENMKYLIFKAKKIFGSKTIVVLKESMDIVKGD